MKVLKRDCIETFSENEGMDEEKKSCNIFPY
jgi:hypothetical protein